MSDRYYLGVRRKLYRNVAVLITWLPNTSARHPSRLVRAQGVEARVRSGTSRIFPRGFPRHQGLIKSCSQYPGQGVSSRLAAPSAGMRV